MAGGREGVGQEKNIHVYVILHVSMYKAIHPYLGYEGSDARVATHDGSQSARRAKQVGAGVVQEVDWCGVVLLTHRKLGHREHTPIIHTYVYIYIVHVS